MVKAESATDLFQSSGVQPTRRRDCSLPGAVKRAKFALCPE
jgi:hypothetical protein